jgi:hypothetical protein
VSYSNEATDQASFGSKDSRIIDCGVPGLEGHIPVWISKDNGGWN